MPCLRLHVQMYHDSTQDQQSQCMDIGTPEKRCPTAADAICNRAFAACHRASIGVDIQNALRRPIYVAGVRPGSCAEKGIGIDPAACVNHCSLLISPDSFEPP